METRASVDELRGHTVHWTVIRNLCGQRVGGVRSRAYTIFRRRAHITRLVFVKRLFKNKTAIAQVAICVIGLAFCVFFFFSFFFLYQFLCRPTPKIEYETVYAHHWSIPSSAIRFLVKRLCVVFGIELSARNGHHSYSTNRVVAKRWRNNKNVIASTIFALDFTLFAELAATWR